MDADPPVLSLTAVVRELVAAPPLELGAIVKEIEGNSFIVAAMMQPFLDLDRLEAHSCFGERQRRCSSTTMRGEKL